MEGQCNGNIARLKVARGGVGREEKGSRKSREIREVLEIRPDGLFLMISRSWIRVGWGRVCTEDGGEMDG